MEGIGNLLSKKLSFFSPNLFVGIVLEEVTDRRGDDCIHLVRIIHCAPDLKLVQGGELMTHECCLLLRWQARASHISPTWHFGLR